MIDEELFKRYAESSLQIRKIFSRRQSGEFSMPQFLTLHLIVSGTTKDNNEFNVSEITNHTDMAMPNVVRMLNEMQMKGYIKRRRDGRNVYVSITEEGKKYHDICVEKTDKGIKDILEELRQSDVSDEEINEFMAMSIKLSEIYSKHFANSRG